MVQVPDGSDRPVAGELSARRPVSRVLCRVAEAARRWPSIWGRRLPDGSCGRPEGCAAHVFPANREPPSYLALLRVELAAFHSGERVAGIVTVALVLASRRVGVTHYPALGSSDFPHAVGVAPGDARPSGRLADRPILPAARPPASTRDADDGRGGRNRQAIARRVGCAPPMRAPGHEPVDRLVAPALWQRGRFHTCSARDRTAHTCGYEFDEPSVEIRRFPVDSAPQQPCSVGTCGLS